MAEVDAETTVVLADIPGLVEGAAQGVGLGHDFLRHIQRTRVLIHLLDGLAEDPLEDFAQTNTELALFDPYLAKKPQIVALNKIDQPEVQERWPKIKKELKKRGYPCMAISALARTDVRELLLKAAAMLAETPALEEVEPPMPVYRPVEDPRAFTILREPDGFRIKSVCNRTHRRNDPLGSIRFGAPLPETDGTPRCGQSTPGSRCAGGGYGLYRRI